MTWCWDVFLQSRTDRCVLSYVRAVRQLKTANGGLYNIGRELIQTLFIVDDSKTSRCNVLSASQQCAWFLTMVLPVSTFRFENNTS